MELNNLKFWQDKLDAAQEILDCAEPNSDIYCQAEEQILIAQDEIEILKILNR